MMKGYPWKRTVIKTVALIVVLMIISAVVNHPVLNNELAMTQIENSNELYIAWEAYNKVRSVLPAICTLIVIVYLVSIVADIYKFNKKKGD